MGLSCVQRWSTTEKTVSSKVITIQGCALQKHILFYNKNLIFIDVSTFVRVPAPNVIDFLDTAMYNIYIYTHIYIYIYIYIYMYTHMLKNIQYLKTNFFTDVWLFLRFLRCIGSSGRLVRRISPNFVQIRFSDTELSPNMFLVRKLFSLIC